MTKVAPQTIQRFGKFFATNLTGTAVDTVALWLLSRLVFESHVGRYVVAPTISFELALINNFIISYFWTWAGRVGRSPAEFLYRFALYNQSAALVFLLKLILLNAIAFFVDIDVVILNLLALIVTGLINFFLQDRFVFRQSLERKSESASTDR